MYWAWHFYQDSLVSWTKNNVLGKKSHSIFQLHFSPIFTQTGIYYHSAGSFYLSFSRAYKNPKVIHQVGLLDVNIMIAELQNLLPVPLITSAVNKFFLFTLSLREIKKNFVTNAKSMFHFVVFLLLLFLLLLLCNQLCVKLRGTLLQTSVRTK